MNRIKHIIKIILKTALKPFRQIPAFDRTVTGLKMRLMKLPPLDEPQTEEASDYIKIEEKFSMNGSKAGIAANWFTGNIFDVLSAYCTYNAVENNGSSPVLFNAPLDLDNAEFESGPEKFIWDNCKVFPRLNSSEKYQNAVESCESFVVSGNALNYNIGGSAGHYFYLDFIPDGKAKILLSGELSSNSPMPEKYRKLGEYYLSGFNSVSVDSADSQSALEAMFNISADVVTSPLFLLSKNDYENIASRAKKNTAGYTAEVFVKPDNTKLGVSNNSRKLTGFSKVSVSLDQEIPDFVEQIIRSNFVITDSSEAAALAVILNKQFVILSDSFEESQKIVRFLKQFGLSERLIYTDAFPGAWEQIFKREINYTTINQQLEYQRRKAIDWLSGALSATPPKKKTISFDGVATPETPEHFTSKPVYKAIDYKIQNLLFPDCSWKYEHWWMMHRGERLVYSDNPVDPKWKLSSGSVECFTYFNSLSIRKWLRYTNAKRYYLHLKVKGKFKIHFFGHWLEAKPEKFGEKPKQTLDEQLGEIREFNIGDISKREFIHKAIREATVKKETFSEYIFDCSALKETDEPVELIIPVEFEKSSVVGWQLDALTPVTIYGGYYSVLCFEEELNRVDISLCTTTFKKEEYINANAVLLKQEVLNNTQSGGMEDLSGHFYLNIVDNGRTLEPSELDAWRVKVYPNQNVGGAGGFTRGMLETIALREQGEFDATHVLFMDDDVKVLPESIKRTYALLQLLKDEHKDRFISGAMLDIDQMNEQHEDLGFCSNSMGTYMSVKPRLALHLTESVLKNEENFSLHDMYAAWWYCVIPVKFVGRDKLSYPIFYRGDDIDFSLRNNAEFITLNGLCVWHLDFSAKVSPSLEFYLVSRNSLITQALDDIAPTVSYFERIKFLFAEEIRKFNYNACDHLLDALDDFLKGPAYIASLDKEYVIKVQGAKNEKLLPLDTFGIIDTSRAYDYLRLDKYDQQLFEETDNGHTLPEHLLRDNMPVISYLFFESPGTQFLEKALLAVDVPNSKAVLHKMDKKRYNALRVRYTALSEKWERDIDKVRAAYRSVAPEWRSEQFWTDYLNLQSGGKDER